VPAQWWGKTVAAVAITAQTAVVCVRPYELRTRRRPRAESPLRQEEDPEVVLLVVRVEVLTAGNGTGMVGSVLFGWC